MRGTSGHDPRLDGLRAVAALMVLGCHTGLTARGGASGVDVFFVLSGWLITGILAAEVTRTGKVDLRAFMVRRARRLWPALASMLAVCVIARPMLWRDALIAATYMTDILAGVMRQPGIFDHTWSLAVEWQFYLIWPAVVTLAVCRPKFAAAAMLAIWMALTVGRPFLVLAGASAIATYSPLHSSGLFLGSALALTPVRLPRWSGWVGLAPLALAMMVDTAGHGLTVGWLVPMVEIATALVISAPPRILAWAPFVRLGEISYGVYLWHLPIWALLLNSGVPLPGLSTLALSALVAALSYRFVERPFRTGRSLTLRGSGTTVS